MLKILQVRLQQYMNHEHLDLQAGFSKSRRTRDQIANIHWIIKKARESHKNIYFCFNDYAKAFDCADHNKLWKILKEMGTPDHLTCLLRNLYAVSQFTQRKSDKSRGQILTELCSATLSSSTVRCLDNTETSKARFSQWWWISCVSLTGIHEWVPSIWSDIILGVCEREDVSGWD